MAPIARPLAERFWSKVSEPDARGCREWLGSRSDRGYGAVEMDGRKSRTHRVAWVLAHGPIPAGLCVCHRCDNPPCVEITHLFLGTLAENSADMTKKGRSTVGARHWTRTKPERAARGARNGAHTKPECVVRGERHGWASLTEAGVREIRTAVAAGKTQRSIAALLGVSASAVNRVVLGLTWRHVV